MKITMECPKCNRPVPTFNVSDGSNRPIVNPRVKDDLIWLNIAPSVWCGGACGWVPITDESYERVTA